MYLLSDTLKGITRESYSPPLFGEIYLGAAKAFPNIKLNKNLEVIIQL